MLLSHGEILDLIDQGVVEGAEYDHVNSASLDLVLGRYIMVESSFAPYSSRPHVISLRDRTPLEMEKRDISGGGYTLQPGEFILAQSKEIFNLPLDVSAEYKLKSSMARIGLEHLNSGWCDAGWNNSVLTLEFTNVTRYHSIHIAEGDKIGQMVFFRHKAVSQDKSYAARGRYNGDKTISVIKL